MSGTAIEKRQGEQLNIANRADEQRQPATTYTPLVDVYETGEAFVFQADLPGVKPADLDIRFENGVITLEGRVRPRQPQGAGYLWREYGVGHFYRQFSLNTPVDADAITAELKNGELTLTVPKAHVARAKKIAINS